MLVFYGGELEDHPLLAVCDCLFNIFTATLHVWRHIGKFLFRVKCKWKGKVKKMGI
jgi:hypothetical protein